MRRKKRVEVPASPRTQIEEATMRSLGILAAGVVFLAAVPSLAQSCNDQIRHTQYVVNHLRPGPNTSAAAVHLRRAREARSERWCYRQVRQAREFAERSRELDRRYGYRY